METQISRKPRKSTKEPGKTTTVHVPERVSLWLLEHGLMLSQLIALGPGWNDRMAEQGNELREMRADAVDMTENIKKMQAKIVKLTDENLELMRFKNRRIASMRTEERT